MSAGLSINGISKTYNSGSQAEVLAVDNCSLEIAPNEFAVIVGPSGCGKTTLLNMLAGFEPLSNGSIYLDGSLIASPSVVCTPGPDRMVVFQHGGLFPWMTALENVCYGPVIRGQLSKVAARRLAMEMLQSVGLETVGSQYPGQMSSGMRRRVEIVRVMIGKPKILLMDEPFRALDALTKTVVQDFLLKLYDEKPSTVLFITHDLIEALFLGDCAFVMTSRPGNVKKLIRINLPRPRTLAMLSSVEFLRLKDELIDSLHDEAVKAFEAGEREAAK